MLILFFFVANLFAAAWTGSTSEPENMKKIDGKPFYVITNADELAWFAAQVNSGRPDINAVLANDIDAEGGDWVTIESFNGIIDGNNQTIKNYNRLFINKLNSNGVVKNMKIELAGQGVYFVEGNIFTLASSKGFVNQNYGLIIHVTNFANVYVGAAIAFENYGTISNCINNGIVGTDKAFLETPKAGIAIINYGVIENCVNNGDVYGWGGGVVSSNKEQGVIRYCRNNGALLETCERRGYYPEGGIRYFCSSSNDLARNNEGLIINSIYKTSIVEYNEVEVYDNGVYVGKNKGLIRNSFGNTSYYLNNTEISSTAENMQRDQFAWILNTSNGVEENSGVWTRGTDGYPTFANEDSLAIRKVVFDDDGTTSNRYTNYKGLVTFPENPEPAEGYVFSGWYNSDDIKVKPTTVFTADQTVNAVYVDASDVFWTINFYNAAPADTVLESKSYQHGSIVAYGGVAPTLAPTAKYTYTFKGWDVEPTNAVEDFDYHAVYDSTIRSYTVTFNNTDGSKIESATFEYGKMPSCSKTPTRKETAEWTYSHKGWKPALDYVTEVATYTAIYDSSKVKYKVTFMNGTTVIDEQMVPYGDPAVAPTNVTREGYKFVGWNTSFATVTEALTVKALFEELIIRTVNVVNVDGDKIVNTTVEDGEKYTLPEAPKKEGYTFDAYYDGDKKLGVAGDEISVTANITIIAKYIENPKSSSSSAVSSSSQQEITSSSSTPRNDESSSSNVSSSSSLSETAESSSSAVLDDTSSSSEATTPIVVGAAPQFSVQVYGRYLQISAARIGATYALFDMQGKVLLQGRVRTANFEIPVMRAGSYLLKIESTTQRVSVR